MTWLEQYERDLDLKLRGRIAHDFPLLEKTHVENLATFLTMDNQTFTKKTLAWVEDQLGSTVATTKFLELYWPSKLPMYIKLLDGRKRRGKRSNPRSGHHWTPGA
jgi:hypothetical protein